MKKVSIASMMLAFSVLSLNGVMKLPTGLYHIANNNIEQTVTLQTNSPLFYIVVPQSPLQPSKSKQMIEAVSKFTQSTTVPKDFFSQNNPEQPTAPVTLLFDWKEQENNQARKNAGYQLSQGVNTLRSNFKKSKIILVGHGQGGNVINNATQTIAQPIDAVIELATPRFPQTRQYAQYKPNIKMINQFFTFYTKQAFATMNPTLHPHYESYQKNVDDPSIKNVLMLVNNQHPLPYQMLSPTVGKRLLQLCQKISSSYVHHNHIITHLSTQSDGSDMVVALYDNSTNSIPGSPGKIGKERFKSTLKHTQFNLPKNINKRAQNRALFKSINHLAQQHKSS